MCFEALLLGVYAMYMHLQLLDFPDELTLLLL